MYSFLSILKEEDLNVYFVHINIHIPYFVPTTWRVIVECIGNTSYWVQSFVCMASVPLHGQAEHAAGVRAREK